MRGVYLLHLAILGVLLPVLAWLGMLGVGALHHITGGAMSAVGYLPLLAGTVAWAAVFEVVRWVTRDRRQPARAES